MQRRILLIGVCIATLLRFGVSGKAADLPEAQQGRQVIDWFERLHDCARILTNDEQQQPGQVTAELPKSINDPRWVPLVTKNLITITPAGAGKFKIIWRGSVDGREFKRRPDKTLWWCSVDYSNSETIVKSAEQIKIGKTRWNGILALIEIRNARYFPIYSENNARPNRPEFFSRRVRALFKQNPFADTWQLIAVDPFYAEGFQSHYVPDALDQD